MGSWQTKQRERKSCVIRGLKYQNIKIQEETHLLDEHVVVDLDVNVDGGIRKCIKDVHEERDAFALSALAETLCTDEDKSRSASD